MKRSLIFSLISIVNLSFGQEKASITKTTDLGTPKFNIEVNHFKENNESQNIRFFSPQALFAKEFSSKKNIAHHFMQEPSSSHALSKSKMETKNNHRRDVFWLLKNAALLEEIISEVPLEYKSRLPYIKTLQVYGDVNLDFYRSYGTLNLLATSSNSSSSNKAMFGQNVLPAISKSHKTTLDKNLTSSLNLAVISF